MWNDSIKLPEILCIIFEYLEENEIQTFILCSKRFQDILKKFRKIILNKYYSLKYLENKDFRNYAINNFTIDNLIDRVYYVYNNL